MAELWVTLSNVISENKLFRPHCKKKSTSGRKKECEYLSSYIKLTDQVTGNRTLTYINMPTSNRLI